MAYKRPTRRDKPIRIRESAATAIQKADRKSGRLLIDEQVAILRMRQRGKSVAAIADTIERSPATVRSFLSKYTDTTPMAEAILRKGAVVMAANIVKRGTVSEHIDVLSRPNIGVLKPVDKAGANSGGFSIHLSVGPASLGVTNEHYTDAEVIKPNQISDGNN